MNLQMSFMSAKKSLKVFHFFNYACFFGLSANFFQCHQAKNR